MTNAPEEPTEEEFTTEQDDAEAAGAPDPVHQSDGEPRFAREGDDDTPEVPMPDPEEGQS